jgi:zinc/manganese transport system permease protein
VATALILVLMLGLGALFLSFTVEYASEIFSLLFGEVLGVSSNEILPVAGLAVVCVLAIGVLYRPLLISSLAPESAAARGVRLPAVELTFLVIVGLATSLTLPVVGALLIFSLMIGPPAAARSLTSSPLAAIGLSVAFALVTVWVAIAASFETNWPIGFFVGTGGAVCYVVGRLAGHWRRSRTRVRRAAAA